MAYIPTQTPANMQSFDELRKWTQDEFRRLAQAYGDDSLASTTSLADSLAALQAEIDAAEAAIATNTTAIAKLTNNQFARVCRITSIQSYSSSILTKVQFNSVSFDPSSIWDATNYRFKPTVAGYYRHSWNIYTSASTNGTGIGSSAKNGTRSALGSFGAPATDISSSGSDILYLNGTTDFVETLVIHTGTSPYIQWSDAGDFSYSAIELVKAD